MSEEETRRAIEIYREEHETWDVERIMSVIAEDAVWQSAGQAPLEGKAAVQANIERMAANPAKRRMRHLREWVDGNHAAVEWEVQHLGADGGWHPYRFGVNLYEVVGGKIRSIRLYGFFAEGGRPAG